MSAVDYKSIEHKIEISVTESSGTVAGILTENVEGTFNFQNLVQLYSISGNSNEPIKYTKSVSPYKYLNPYTVEDEVIFKGREKEKEQILDRINQKELLVIYGDPGVGKTSLLSAAVIPELARKGNIVFRIQDYIEPEKAIFEAVKHFNRNSQLKKDSTLFEIIKSISEESNFTNLTCRIVLIFDQFELLFEQPFAEPKEREDFVKNFIYELKRILDDFKESPFNLIIVAQPQISAEFAVLGANLLDFDHITYEIKSLTEMQARQAIFESLDSLNEVSSNKPTIFEEGGNFRDRIIRDLDSLTDNDPGYIYPPHLQIVCKRLFENAIAKGGVRRINSEVYSEASVGSADKIIASYINESIVHIPEEKRKLVGDILSVMRTPGFPKWIEPNNKYFNLKNVSDEDIYLSLELLVKAKLLKTSYNLQKKVSFAFISPVIPYDVGRWLKTRNIADTKEQATEELERIWYSWLALEHYASPEELIYLASAIDNLNLDLPKTLMLLRSSIEENEPINVWIKKLENEEGVALINKIEEPNTVIDENSKNIRLDESDVSKAKVILFRSPEEILKRKENLSGNEGNSSEEQYHSISEAAVSHPSPLIRRICAIALVIPGNIAAVNRINLAIQNKKNGKSLIESLKNKFREIELLSVLAETDLLKGASYKSRPDKILVWGWRASANIVQNYERLLVIMICGALGAGFFTAIAQSLFPQNINYVAPRVGIAFYINGLMGAALSFGLSLAMPLSLAKITENNSSDHHYRNTFATNLASFLLAILLGTFCFGLMNIFVIWMNNGKIFGNGFPILINGCILGAVFSLLLTLEPFKDSRTKNSFDKDSKQITFLHSFLHSFSAPYSDILNGLLRIIIVAFIMGILKSYFFEDSKITRLNTIFVSFESNLTGELSKSFDSESAPWWIRLCKLYMNLKMMVVLNTALFGAFLMTGLTLGISVGENFLKKIHRAS